MSFSSSAEFNSLCAAVCKMFTVLLTGERSGVGAG